MNINCPKCGFNQPEDQYCASCGIDMATYEPPKTPLWKKVASNWIFQLGVLLLIVIVLVSRDMIFPPQNSIKISNRGLPPVEQKSFRGSGFVDYESPAPTKAAAVKPPSAKPGAKKVLPPGAKPAPKVTKKKKARKLRKRIGAFFYLASREQIDFVISQGDAIDEGVFSVPARAFAVARKQNSDEWKKLRARGPSFEFGTPKLLFFGSDNRGFYFRTTVIDQPDPKNLNVEIRTWYEFKKDEPVDGLTLAHTLPRKNVLIFTGFSPKTGLLSAEDKKSSDPVFSALSDPQFAEDVADLVLVMQLK